jgi:hypothetical protein
VAVLGVAAAAWGALGRQWPAGLVPPVAIAILAAVAAGLLLAPASNNFLERYARVARSPAPGADAVKLLDARPDSNDKHGTVAFASRAVLGTLAGNHFTRKLRLVPARTSCPTVARLVGNGPFVVT